MRCMLPEKINCPMLEMWAMVDFTFPMYYSQLVRSRWGSMGYWEVLPQQCPPADAADVAISEAYRLVGANPPAKDHFASYAKLGKPKPPTVDPCSWASCSLFTSLTHLRNMSALPKIRDAGAPFVAKLSLPVGAGMSRLKRKHVDFWMFDTFDPTSAVSQVEPV